jgi:CDP-diacylglycerol--serine O-phosphatidyltransferase
MKHIPNLFTLLNLVFGCLAIVCILQNGIAIQYNEQGAQFVDIPEKNMAGFLVYCDRRR